jgi:hypothetical protein
LDWLVTSRFVGLVTQSAGGPNDILQVFPENEVRKGQLTMELKKLKETQEKLAWPSDSNDLPVISWESCE